MNGTVRGVLVVERSQEPQPPARICFPGTTKMSLRYFLFNSQDQVNTALQDDVAIVKRSFKKVNKNAIVNEFG